MCFHALMPTLERMFILLSVPFVYFLGNGEGGGVRAAEGVRAEPVVRLASNHMSVAFGNAIEASIEIDGGVGVSVPAFDPLTVWRRFLKFKKDGNNFPALWFDYAQDEDNANAFLRDGKLWYNFKNVFILPGDYEIECNIPMQGRMLASNRLKIEVVDDPDRNTLAVITEIMRDALAKAGHHAIDAYLVQIHRVLDRLPGEDPDFAMVEYLGAVTEDKSQAGSLLKSEMIQVLGKHLSASYSKEFNRARGRVPVARILDNMARERSFEALFNYFMIMLFVKDRMTESEIVTLRKLVDKHRNSPHPDVVYGAYVAGINNDAVREAIGVEVLERGAMNNRVMGEGSKATVLELLRKVKRE